MPGGIAWIDTGALVALASPRDQYHARAVALAQSFAQAGGRWVSSVLVLAEFHWQMLRRSGPAVARSSLAPVLADPAYRWLDVTTAIVSRAVNNWLERFHDQDFSLTDAVSFELMKREGLTEAFAFDRHYVVAGFQLLQ
ncbi:MAG: PIN domain-containing protein [Gemmatimonadetes bacterium]|nr:PIN domain-containing protein [Gemmatimonadota bacterium]